MVFAGPDGYPGDEAYFLHFIVHTVHEALKSNPALDSSRLGEWVAQRHRQIESERAGVHRPSVRPYRPKSRSSYPGKTLIQDFYGQIATFLHHVNERAFADPPELELDLAIADVQAVDL